MSMTSRTSLIAVAAIVLSVASPAWGVPTLTVVGQGNGRYDVIGQRIESVGGITMTLDYDRATATNPNVLVGGLSANAIMTPNLIIPGTVKIVIISPNRQGISGSGTLATLTLSPVADKQGSITKFSAQLVSATAFTEIPVKTEIIAAGDSGAIVAAAANSSGVSRTTSGAVATTSGTTATTAAGTSTTSTGTTTSSAGSIGALQLTGMAAGSGSSRTTEAPGSGHQPAATPPLPDIAPDTPPTPVPEPEAQVDVVKPPPAAAPEAVKKVEIPRSVPDLFKGYAGEKSLTALGALFSAGASPDIRQEPAIALSDGTATVLVFLKVPPGGRAPTFALSGAKLVSLQNEDGLYLLEVRPAVGANEAMLMMFSNDNVTGIPLTVAQPLDPALVPSGALTDATAALLLKGVSGKRKDVNGDGEVTWLDDYIITANYLAGKKAATPKPPPTVATAVVPGAAAKQIP
jgi:hypothetical protein